MTRTPENASVLSNQGLLSRKARKEEEGGVLVGVDLVSCEGHHARSKSLRTRLCETIRGNKQSSNITKDKTKS